MHSTSSPGSSTHDGEACSNDELDEEIRALAAPGAERSYHVDEVTAGLYKQNLAQSLSLWNDYRKEQDLPIDPERPFPDRPSQGNIHSFLLWLLRTRRGRLGEKRIAVTTLQKQLFMFKTMYKNLTQDEIEISVIRQLKKAIQYYFVAKGASVKARPRSLANRAVVLDLLHFLWALDEFAFPHPRLRLQLSLGMMLLFYLGGRPGEIAESAAHPDSNEGLLYQDLTFIVVTRGGSKRVIVLLKVRNQKFRRNREKCFIDMPLIQDVTNPELCPVTQLLALAIADGALCGIQTAEDLELKVNPADNCHAILRINERIKDLPVLRRPRGARISPTKILTAKWLGKEIGLLSTRAGYEKSLTPYDLRRGHANVLNGHVSAAVRRQRMGHKSDDTFLHYISSVSAVDTQAMLHGHDAENDLLDFVKSAELRRTGARSNIGNGMVIPEKDNDAFPLRTTYSVASTKHERVADYYAGIKVTQQASRQLRAQLRHEPTRSEIIRMFYHRQEDHGVEVHLRTVLGPLIDIARSEQDEWSYADAAKPDEGGRCSICAYIPSTNSVSSATDFKRHLLDCTMVARTTSARQELRALIHKRHVACGWSGCQQEFKGQTLQQIARHMGRHTRKFSDPRNAKPLCHHGGCNRHFDSRDALMQHILGEHSVPHREVLPSWHYCFECRLFSKSDLDWRRHCDKHLDMLDMSCGPIQQKRKAIIFWPGTCPFCHGDSHKPPEAKYMQFPSARSLQEHVLTHLSRKTVEWPFSCPHPLCGDEVTSLPDFWLHLTELHDIKAPHSSGQAKMSSPSNTKVPSSRKGTHHTSVTALAMEEASIATSNQLIVRTASPQKPSELAAQLATPTTTHSYDMSPVTGPLEAATNLQSHADNETEGLPSKEDQRSANLAVGTMKRPAEESVAPVSKRKCVAECYEETSATYNAQVILTTTSPLAAPDVSQFPSIPRAFAADDGYDLGVLHAQVDVRVRYLKEHDISELLASHAGLQELVWTTILASEDLLFHFYEGEEVGADSLEALEKDVAWMLRCAGARECSVIDVAKLAAARNLPISSKYLSHPAETLRPQERKKEELAEDKARRKAARQQSRCRREQETDLEMQTRSAP